MDLWRNTTVVSYHKICILFFPFFFHSFFFLFVSLFFLLFFLLWPHIKCCIFFIHSSYLFYPNSLISLFLSLFVSFFFVLQSPKIFVLLFFCCNFSNFSEFIIIFSVFLFLHVSLFFFFSFSSLSFPFHDFLLFYLAWFRIANKLTINYIS